MPWWTLCGLHTLLTAISLPLGQHRFYYRTCPQSASLYQRMQHCINGERADRSCGNTLLIQLQFRVKSNWENEIYLQIKTLLICCLAFICNVNFLAIFPYKTEATIYSENRIKLLHQNSILKLTEEEFWLLHVSSDDHLQTNYICGSF